jgi:hypothetical protein
MLPATTRQDAGTKGFAGDESLEETLTLGRATTLKRMRKRRFVRKAEVTREFTRASWARAEIRL